MAKFGAEEIETREMSRLLVAWKPVAAAQGLLGAPCLVLKHQFRAFRCENDVVLDICMCQVETSETCMHISWWSDQPL